MFSIKPPIGSGPTAENSAVFNPNRCAPTAIFTGEPPIAVVNSFMSLNSAPIFF